MPNSKWLSGLQQFLPLAIIAVAAVVASNLAGDLLLANWPKPAKWSLFIGALLVVAWGTLRGLLSPSRPSTTFTLIAASLLFLAAILIRILTPPPNALIPDDANLPEWVPDCFPNDPKVIFGRNVVSSPELPFIAVGFQSVASSIGESIISLHKNEGEDTPLIHVKVKGEDGTILAEIRDENVPTASKVVNMKLSGDQHNVVVWDQFGLPDLHLYFLNDTTVQILNSNFRHPEFPTLNIGVDNVTLEGWPRDEEPRCIRVEGPIWRGVDVTQDGVRWNGSRHPPAR